MDTVKICHFRQPDPEQLPPNFVVASSTASNNNFMTRFLINCLALNEAASPAWEALEATMRLPKKLSSAARSPNLGRCCLVVDALGTESSKCVPVGKLWQMLDCAPVNAPLE